MRNLFLIAFLFPMGCKHNSQNALKNQTIITKSQSHFRTDTGLIKEQTPHRKSELDDSSQLKIMMHDILIYAEQHRKAASYHKKLNSWGYMPGITSATITFGHIFDISRKHLIVRRSIGGSIVSVDVFLLTKNSFQLVCSTVLNNLTYINDTIEDVNGDNKKDFLVHWYPSSGCCRRDMFKVYLYEKENGTFTAGYEFINPTFSPSEKVIRGVGYGQPRDVELYKYKWNGLKVDTVEIIFPDTLRKRYHVFKHWNDYDNLNAGRFLTAVPKQYRKIESYDWFMGVY